MHIFILQLIKKTLWPLFIDRIQLSLFIDRIQLSLKAAEDPRGGNLVLTTESSGVPDTHLIYNRRMKG